MPSAALALRDTVTRKAPALAGAFFESIDVGLDEELRTVGGDRGAIDEATVVGR